MPLGKKETPSRKSSIFCSGQLGAQLPSEAMTRWHGRPFPVHGAWRLQPAWHAVGYPSIIGQLAISGHRPHGISATSSHTRSKKSSRATIFPTPLLSLVYRTGGKCQVLRLKNRQGRGKYAILICGIFEREREEALCSIKFWCWTSTVP